MTTDDVFNNRHDVTQLILLFQVPPNTLRQISGKFHSAIVSTSKVIIVFEDDQLAIEWLRQPPAPDSILEFVSM